MSYELDALLSSAELLDVAAAEVPVARVTRLAQGLALIPMTERLRAAFGFPGDRTRDGFDRLSAGFGRRLEAWSQAGPIAYVEAEFFGGKGVQRAAVWVDGRIELGPLYAGKGDPWPPEGSPISRALRRLGATVTADPADPAGPAGGRGPDDEFEAVGLGLRRRSQDWS